MAFIPLLQANGLDVNWWKSLAAYILILGSACGHFAGMPYPDQAKKATDLLCFVFLHRHVQLSS